MTTAATIAMATLAAVRAALTAETLAAMRGLLRDTGLWRGGALSLALEKFGDAIRLEADVPREFREHLMASARPFVRPGDWGTVDEVFPLADAEADIQCEAEDVMWPASSSDFEALEAAVQTADRLYSRLLAVAALHARRGSATSQTTVKAVAGLGRAARVYADARVALGDRSVLQPTLW